MDRIGHVWRLKAGMAQEYERRHAEIWPELAHRLRQAGVRSYHIYRWEDILFSHMDVDDFPAAVNQLAGDLISEDCERHMTDLIEYPDQDPVTGWPHQLQHVWSLKDINE